MQHLEKIPQAARRMAVSVSQVYREIQKGSLQLVKLGPRGSALTSESVDAWITARIQESSGKKPNAKAAQT